MKTLVVAVAMVAALYVWLNRAYQRALIQRDLRMKGITVLGDPVQPR